MNLKLIKYIIIFTVLFRNVITLNTCERHITCHECITDPNICVWCTMDNSTGYRCKPANTYKNDWCLNHVENPKSSRIIIQNKEFSSDLGKVVQIRPQRYKFQLRPGESVDFEFSFKGAKDYPVDMYFLLDASLTMTIIQTEIAAQSENIYRTMSNITKDVYLGMGTFIDKNALPYTQINDSVETYSFRNRLKLTHKYEDFKEKVYNMPFGSNYDAPEGGLDALAQVIICKEEIGWRNESRKIVIFLTDGPYHAAGDGRLAGIFQPYDGQCHTKDGIYTKELEMDYPSVSILNRMAAKEEVTIIFLIDNYAKYHYISLSSAISGSKFVALANSNKNMANTLKEIYEQISKTIILKVDMKSDDREYFQITFSPDCKNNNDAVDCNVEKEKEKRFVGTIKLLKYYETDNVLIDIVSKGIKEKLTLDIDIIKDCECEKVTGEINSTACHYGGTLQCGICKCNANRNGNRCECSSTKSFDVHDNSTCVAEGSDKICSGHGICFCGLCQCRNRYDGQFCQCNMDSCPRGSSKNLCSDHGDCVCGICKCRPEWSGEACDCLKSTASCVDSDGTICNNRGECVCGSCRCQANAQWDVRNHQDQFCKMLPCSDCHNRQCRALEPCALCLHKATDDCSDVCDILIKSNVTESLDSIPNDVKNTWNSCANIRVNFGCYTNFLYKYGENKYEIELFVQTEHDCLKSYYVFGGISLVTALFIGLATLLGWKVLTYVRDKREYERFIKQHEADLSGPCVNPIYETPTTIFNNPAFRKRSVDLH